jgi:hypothetical protein
VPVVSLFLGIVIRMYHDEHPPPHFHAAYQGFEAFVRIEDGETSTASCRARRRGSFGNGRWTIVIRSWQTGCVARCCCRWR